MKDASLVNVVDTNVEAVNAKISKNTGAIFSILTESVYSDPVKAGIREIISNALDANNRAGSKRPIEIDAPTNFQTRFVVRDFGNGLSEEEVHDIYLSLGESTKKETNNEIGFFGIGALSPLALVDNFFVTSYHNGMQTSYSVFMNESQIPQITKIHEKPNPEESGISVSYEVPRNQLIEFTSKIDEVLQYVEPKKYHGVLCKFWLDRIEKHYIEYNRDDVIITRNSYYSHSHNEHGMLIMGGVGYTFRFSDLKETSLSKYRIFITAPIGSVSVQASREALKMNNKTKRYLNDKITQTERQLADVIAEEVEKCNNIVEASKHLDSKTILPTKSLIKWKGKQVTFEAVVDLLKTKYNIAYCSGSTITARSIDSLRNYHRPSSFGSAYIILDDSARGCKSTVGKSSSIQYSQFFLLRDEHPEIDLNIGDIFSHKATDLLTNVQPNNITSIRKTSTCNKIISSSYARCCLGDEKELDDDFDEFYITRKRFDILYKEHTFKLTNISRFTKLWGEQYSVYAIQEKQTIPPKAKCFITYLIKQLMDKGIQEQKKHHFATYLDSRYDKRPTHNRSLFLKREDLQKSLNGFITGEYSLNNIKDLSVLVANSIMRRHIDNMASVNDLSSYWELINTIESDGKSLKKVIDLCDKFKAQIEKVIKDKYPLYTKIGGSYLQNQDVIDYITTGDQNEFEIHIK